MSSDALDLTPLLIQLAGTFLFFLVFLFLWRQSGILYFQYWGWAWLVESVGLGFEVLGRASRRPQWLALHSLLEFGFALSLLAGARISRGSGQRGTKFGLRLLLYFPLFLLLISAVKWQYTFFHATHSLVLSVIFGYSFFTLGRPEQFTGGWGSRMFRFTLLALSITFLHHAIVFVYAGTHHHLPAWMGYFRFLSLYNFSLQMLLAFSAMAMWVEDQNDRITHLGNEIDQVRRESAANADLDYLTGLLNQSALNRQMRDTTPIEGTVAVCDIDSFKPLNDRFGHLVGDEILRNIGHLIRSSMRAEDSAWRWGGDEFVMLFRNEDLEVVRRRMIDIARRLHDFRVRGHGMVAIDFSWGVAPVASTGLRSAIEIADREMYAQKRLRKVAR